MSNVSDVVMDAVDACVDAGTITRGQRIALKFVRAMRPRAFARNCNRLAYEVGSEHAVNPDNLERLLQLLIEYLPQLLAIILPLFQGDE